MRGASGGAATTSTTSVERNRGGGGTTTGPEISRGDSLGFHLHDAGSVHLHYGQPPAGKLDGGPRRWNVGQAVQDEAGHRLIIGRIGQRKTEPRPCLIGRQHSIDEKGPLGKLAHAGRGRSIALSP